MNIADRAGSKSWPMPVARRRDLCVRVLQRQSDVLAIARDWRNLESVAPGATLFQTFEWCRNVIEHFGEESEGSYRIYCVYHDEQLIGLLPLKISKGVWGAVLTGLCEPYQQYTEMLLHPDHDAKTVLDFMWPQVARSGADQVFLGHVRDDGPLFVAGKHRFQRANEADAAPFVDLSIYKNYEAYFKTIKTKTRKNMRNARNRLERRGVVTHCYCTEGPQLANVVDRTFTGRLDWQRRMGRTSGAFQDAGFKTFLDRFKFPGRTKIAVLALSLFVDGKPIADQWGFIVGGRYYAYLSTFDTAYEDVSPGRMHLGEVVKVGYGEGLRCLDFMAPVVPYKLTWTTGAVGVQDFMVSFTLKGKLYAGIWQKRLRPLVKHSAQKLPDGFRSLLVKLFSSRH